VSKPDIRYEPILFIYNMPDYKMSMYEFLYPHICQLRNLMDLFCIHQTTILSLKNYQFYKKYSLFHC